MKALVLTLLLSLPGFSQSASSENQVRERGQTRPADESQSWTRGRLGTQAPIPYKLQNVSGILVDASCDDRSSLNLRQRPAPDIAPPPNPRAPVAADPRSREAAERAGVTPHENADLRTRQPDPSCAVNGGTRAFALLLPNGRLLNLDEGGTTLVWQRLNSLPQGRAMLNGAGPAFKPQFTLRGRVNGDRLIVDRIVNP